MRSALVLLAVLGLAGCTAEAPPSSIETPAGPCAKTREQPPDGSQEQRLQGDLDGDGRTDEVVSWVRDGSRVVQAWLATGENAAPQQLVPDRLLATGDVDGDGRDEVFGQLSSTTGSMFVLDGCTLTRTTQDGQPWAFPIAQGPLLCRGQGVLDQLRRPRDPAESAQGTLVTHRYRYAAGVVSDEGDTISRTDVRADDLETADAPVLCD